MKNFIFLLSLFFSTYLFGEKIIGYGSSDAVHPKKSQERWYMGFKLGYEEFNKSNFKVIEKKVFTGEKLGALNATKYLLKKGASLIVGFPTSHEALLSSKASKGRKKILSIFAGAGHSSLKEKGANVVTTGESMRTSTLSVLQFINEKINKKDGVLVYNPKAVFSVNQKDFVEKNLKNEVKDLQINLKYISLTKRLTMKQMDLSKLKQAKYIWMTQYADESKALLEQLQENGIDLPIISNSSWTTGDIEFIRRLLLNKKSKVYSFAIWTKNNKYSKKFNQLITQKYGVEPNSELAHGYDLGVITAKIANRAKISGSSFLEAFNKNRCFKDTTTGDICFPSKGGHATKKLTPMLFDKTTFSEIR